MIKQLKDKQWDEFLLVELGNIQSGKDIAQIDMVEGNIPYITAGSINNGINNFVGNNNNSLESKCISINRTGSVGYAFYHDYEALFSNNCRKFKLTEHNNKYVSLFIVNQIKEQKDKYSYGYIMGTERLKRQKILLPVDENHNPDYKFMEDYIKYIYEMCEHDFLKKIDEKLEKLNYVEIDNLSEKNWANFKLYDIFDSVQRGKRLTKANFIDGKTPFISSSGLNNGVDAFIGNSEKVRIFNNCLTLANSGSVGSTFFHPYTFVASDHVTQLKNEKFDKYIYLFLAPLIKRLSEKYNYNREMNDARLERELLFLPILENGEPDYNYMRQFMINQEILLLKKYKEYIQNNNSF